METETIAEILGGRKVLGKAIRKPDDLAQLVRAGLPAGSVSALAERLHLGNGVLSRKLGIPQRTLTRRLSHGSLLTAAESDRTVRMARVCANAVEMIGDQDKAIEWLGTPNRALGGERPLDQLDTDTGARMVEDILGRIAYGVYSCCSFGEYAAAAMPQRRRAARVLAGMAAGGTAEECAWSMPQPRYRSPRSRRS